MPKKDEPSTRFNMVVSPSQLARWREAAAKSKRDSLADWCRVVLDSAAESVLSGAPSPESQLEAERQRIDEAVEALRGALENVPPEVLAKALQKT